MKIFTIYNFPAKFAWQELSLDLNENPELHEVHADAPVQVAQLVGQF